MKFSTKPKWHFNEGFSEPVQYLFLSVDLITPTLYNGHLWHDLFACVDLIGFLHTSAETFMPIATLCDVFNTCFTPCEGKIKSICEPPK